MIAFTFTINRSFKTQSTHPIAVPKSQVEYKKLTCKGLDSGELTIRFQHGETAKGYMYAGVAGLGPHYQIRIHSDEKVPNFCKKEAKCRQL